MPFAFVATPIQDLLIVESTVFADERGWFMESYQKKVFVQGGIDADFVQDNQSVSHKGVVRGLHFQTSCVQAKLIGVAAGAIFDMAVDLRNGSPTFGHAFGLVLTASNHTQLFVPRGFAHGFLTLEDDTHMLYKCDDLYAPSFDGGILPESKELSWDTASFADVVGEYDLEKTLVRSSKDAQLLEFDPAYSYFL